MSEDVHQLERDRQIAERREEYKLEAQAEFQLIQRGDYIKPGWWHWRCRREDVTGDVSYGYVQADSLGRTIAPETFENDRK